MDEPEKAEPMRLVAAPATFDVPRMYAEVCASFGLALHFHTVKQTVNVHDCEHDEERNDVGFLVQDVLWYPEYT